MKNKNILILSDKNILKLVQASSLVSDKKIKDLVKKAESENVPIYELLLAQKIISDTAFGELLAKQYHVGFKDLTGIKLNKETLDILPMNVIREKNVVIFEKDEKGKFSVGMIDPTDLAAKNLVRKAIGENFEVYLITFRGLEYILNQYRKDIHSTLKNIVDTASIRKKKESKKDKKSLEEQASEISIVKLIDSLLENAILEGASDIHIEPYEKEIIVRFRIDGILRDVMSLPKSIHPAVVARIKVLSELKIDEHRHPQDGRFKIENEKYKIAFRVSTMPVYDGEKVVLRLLDEDFKDMTLESIGLSGKSLQLVEKNSEKPHGMILVTGPTGSGKTTTLYTILHKIQSPKINISTVEDPIEYKMYRINQSQVHQKIGFTFATGLRSLLRQDPDVIMVGEIRDTETAKMATHAALTGHLVLSTLHTNSSIGALPRLSEMGVEPFLIASSVNLIIAQRLVRKICMKCIQSYTLGKKEILELEEKIHLDEILGNLSERGIIEYNSQEISKLLFYRGRGCDACLKKGYKGRIGIYEVLDVTNEIKSLILQGKGEVELMKAARNQGFLTMPEDGFAKAKMGITTIEEVLRVTKE